ncbi:hypothetical protein ACH5RR_012051 [Cinchona calisaya]|uniref:Uncharacterized protein n=1 Tax=Cinchona calisaya TaxID=153742 RepID=A0ABD3AA23_9GENT
MDGNAPYKEVRSVDIDKGLSLEVIVGKDMTVGRELISMAKDGCFVPLVVCAGDGRGCLLRLEDPILENLMVLEGGVGIDGEERKGVEVYRDKGERVMMGRMIW